ncbi:MAG: glycosyltransferase family 2 protein [Acidobacteria bacterium]|nr:glycosyltransferase family 2 protein [Bryobacteraceae bacterium CoA2 C42]
MMVLSMLFLGAYALRHYYLGYARMRLEHPREMNEFVGFVMPRVTVLVPMHNEEKVARDILQALVKCDYDWELLEVIPVNDRSTDGTRGIVDDFARRYPFIKPYHRLEGAGGKPAALAEASDLATGEIFLLFDADYVPGPAVLKMLTAPFADPEVGAVMGRVVPHNIGDSLLSVLLSLERCAGYQSAQQARFNLGFTAQFGGTVGGVRASALRAVGGWNPESLTEDTDLTMALLLNGWRTAYVNRAECYEEVPRNWAVRRRQLSRWVMGHTECLHNYWPDLLQARFLSRREKADAIFLLGMYLTAPLIVVGWVASLVLFIIPSAHVVPVLPVAMLVIGYLLFSNQATFFEIGVAALLDGTRTRALLMPLSLLNFFANTGAICHALGKFYWQRIWGSGGDGWYKTHRTRLGGEGPEVGAGPGPGGAARHRVRGLYSADGDGERG